MSSLEYRFPDTKIIKWKQELHKFKIQYKADSDGQPKGQVSLPCTPAEMQQEMNRVIRYILHHRDQLKPLKLQTDYIRVDCCMKVWQLPSVVHFEKAGRKVQAYPNMFCLTVNPRKPVKSLGLDGHQTLTIGANLGAESQDKCASAGATGDRGARDDTKNVNRKGTDVKRKRRVTESRSEPRLSQHPVRVGCRDKSPDNLSGFNKLRRDSRMRQRRYSEITGLEGDGDYPLGDISPRPPQVFDCKVQEQREPTDKKLFDQVPKKCCLPDRPRPSAELEKTPGSRNSLGNITNNVTTKQIVQSEKSSTYLDSQIKSRTPPYSGFQSPSKMDRAQIEEEELAEQRILQELAQSSAKQRSLQELAQSSPKQRSLQELAQSSAKSTQSRKRRKSMLETMIDVLFVTPVKRLFGPPGDIGDD